MNFWQQLKKPIIGLSPMDGVTDIAYRQVQAKYGKPQVIFTEFIPVEGIVRLNERLLQDFWYTSGERPVIAQIYGKEPELFYASAQLVCELGFDGIDINMGCPAKSVVHRGCGAALIRTPELAVELIRAVQRGVEDWAANGVDWQNWPVISGEKAKRLFEEFIVMSQQKGIYNDLERDRERIAIPISVKTRIGFAEPEVEAWISTLLPENLAALTLHGRTLKQLYTGSSDWSQLQKAAQMRDEYQADVEEKTIILGSGDAKTWTDAVERCQRYGLDGALIGRGTYGKPWVLSDGDRPSDIRQIFQIAVEHAQLHEKYKDERAFVQMRKNLAWYISGIPDASSLRVKLMQANTARSVEEIFSDYLLQM